MTEEFATAKDDGGPSRRAGVAITLRPLGTPLPLGFFAFGMGMVLTGGLSLGWVPRTEAQTVAILLLGFVAPLELAAGVIAFLARDSFAGTALTLFGASWVVTGLAGVVDVAAPPSEALGLLQFFFAAIVGLLAVAGIAGKPLLGVILGVASAQAVLGGLFAYTGAREVDDASGLVAICLAGFSLYGGLALLLEDTRQRAVLPIFRRSRAEEALEGSLDEQLMRAEREAGVRQQL